MICLAAMRGELLSDIDEGILGSADTCDPLTDAGLPDSDQLR